MLSSLKNRLLIAVGVVSLLSVVDAKGDIFTSCGIDLGQFRAAGFLDAANSRTAHWGAFTLGGSFVSDISAADDLENIDIYGDVGVAAAGDIKMGSGATIHGDLYYRTGGTLTMNGTSRITGGRHQNASSNAILDQGVADADRISMQAFALPASDMSLTTVNMQNQSFTYTLTSTCTVLKLTDFVMDGGTFTLSGTAGQAIILNVTRNFSLKGGAKIVLSGGLQWDSVLFNIVGTGNVVSFDQASSLNGILLANRRTVRMKNSSTVDGEVIGNSIQIGSLSKIRNPSVASP